VKGKGGMLSPLLRRGGSYSTPVPMKCLWRGVQDGPVEFPGTKTGQERVLRCVDVESILYEAKAKLSWQRNSQTTDDGAATTSVRA
jgi:hypothetical protein